MRSCHIGRAPRQTKGKSMRLTMRTNLAMRVLMYCAANPGRRVRKHDIAQACNASENHLAQVIHALGTRGYVQTLRGRGGGLTLARPAKDIRVGEVFRDLEADVPFTECFSDTENACPLRDCCRLRCVLADAVESFYARLDEVTLDRLVSGNDTLQRMLAVDA